ncbi:MAG: P27 family phage terminase small subunit [Vicinamibacteria bacterium]|nr:P27 family phage terminase small subunit [Vicinamibacteria bacterium]
MHLAAQAREVWCELAPEMTNAGLLTVGDVPLFASFCACEAQVRRLGVMVEDLDLANDFSQAAGRVRRAHAAALDKVLLIGREFGLTPSSRTRIGVEPAGKLTAEDIRAMLRA